MLHNKKKAKMEEEEEKKRQEWIRKRVESYYVLKAEWQIDLVDYKRSLALARPHPLSQWMDDCFLPSTFSPPLLPPICFSPRTYIRFLLLLLLAVFVFFFPLYDTLDEVINSVLCTNSLQHLLLLLSKSSICLSDASITLGVVIVVDMRNRHNTLLSLFLLLFPFSSLTGFR